MITRLLSQKYVYVGITGAAAVIVFLVTLPPQYVMSSHTPDDVVCSGCVGSGDIGSAAVTNAKIATGAVTNGKIASNAVTSTKIFDGTISAADLGANSVGASEIATNAVGAAEIDGVTKLLFNECFNATPSLAHGESFTFNCLITGASPGDNVIATVNFNGCLAVTQAYVSSTDIVKVITINGCTFVMNPVDASRLSIIVFDI